MYLATVSKKTSYPQEEELGRGRFQSIKSHFLCLTQKLKMADESHAEALSGNSYVILSNKRSRIHVTDISRGSRIFSSFNETGITRFIAML